MHNNNKERENSVEKLKFINWKEIYIERTAEKMKNNGMGGRLLQHKSTANREQWAKERSIECQKLVDLKPSNHLFYHIFMFMYQTTQKSKYATGIKY